jgi:hypothetical protein
MDVGCIVLTGATMRGVAPGMGLGDGWGNQIQIELEMLHAL